MEFSGGIITSQMGGNLKYKVFILCPVLQRDALKMTGRERFSHIHRMARQCGLIPAECPMLWSAKLPLWNGKTTIHSGFPCLQWKTQKPLREETGLRWRKRESSNSGMLAEKTAREVHPFSLCQGSCHAMVSEAGHCRESPLWIALPESPWADMNGWGHAGDLLWPSTPVLHFPKDPLLTVTLWEATARGLRVQPAGYRDWLPAHRRWFYFFFQITKSL